VEHSAEAGGGGHVHRWRIEAQGGPVSAGSCACGAVREFANSWDRDSSAWALSRGRAGRGANQPGD